MFDKQFRSETEKWLRPIGTSLKRTGVTADHLTVLGNKLLFTAPNGVDRQGFSTDTELFAASMK